MLTVFLEVVLPVALVAVAGALIGRWRQIAVAPVSALVFYLFSPALVFHSIATTEVSGELSLRIIAVMLATYAAMYVVATAWSTAAHHDRSLRAGFALAATTPNAGNMGLPIALLAYGEPGLEIAVVNFVVGAVLTYSAGIAIASTAGGSAIEAVRMPLRYPVVYAAAAGMAMNALGAELPVSLDAPTETLADAAVPTMLVVLGLQLRSAVGMDRLLDTAAVNAARLLVGPAVAYVAASALALEGVTHDTLVVLAAMPTAVVSTIIATEFRAAPAFVTRAVVTSTLTSMATVTLLITLLR